MKKLLAMVLCVMMFVSILSTSAFANKPTVPAHPDLDYGHLAPEQSVAANNKAVKNAKANIEYMYGSLAADTAVFGTIQSVDSIISSFAKTLFDGTDGIDTIYGTILPGTLESNTKAVLRDYIGSEIIRDLNDNSSKFAKASSSYRVVLADGTAGSLTYTGQQTPLGSHIYVDADGQLYALASDGTGWWVAAPGTSVHAAADHASVLQANWAPAAVGQVTLRTEYTYDPIAYANAFASAATKAISGKEGASMLEALAYQLYSMKVYGEMDDKFDDLFDDIVAWEDGNAILSQYHFHDTYNPTFEGDWFGLFAWDGHDVFSPYAFMDLDDYPNAISVTSAILAP
jgi:hypothetical protein